MENSPVYHTMYAFTVTTDGYAQMAFVHDTVLG